MTDNTRQLLKEIERLDVGTMPISSYNANYLRRILPHIDYYFDIYDFCMQHLKRHLKSDLASATVVDYGGGHGLFSLFMKAHGVGRVIYCDCNQLSVDTAKHLSTKLNIAADEYITADSDRFACWCSNAHLVPDALVGLDVIEHIYSLDQFFSDAYSVNPSMPMLFTTASNPYNRRKCKKLRQWMISDELGTDTHEGFCAMRRKFISQHFSELSEQQIDYWAKNTRGLNYDDILRAVECQSPNLLRDAYNTCDPESGSWTERILSIEEYNHIVNQYGYTISVDNGFYNSNHGTRLAALRKIINRQLLRNRHISIAPFILLTLLPTID